MNVLNLVTGKSKYLTDFNFTAQTIDGVEYTAKEYWNVRAIVVAEDGAFYGFNKDLNVDPEVFNFDPMRGIQKKVSVPNWIQEYINNYNDYATPFLVIEPRE
jgi:diphthamide synthase subunit DPH2